MTPVPVEMVNMACEPQNSAISQSFLWRLRVGRIGDGGLDAIIKNGFANGVGIGSVKPWELCGRCALGKQTRV